MEKMEKMEKNGPKSEKVLVGENDASSFLPTFYISPCYFLP